jgi:glyoxylase-like metal-dependent hydrolase (beta-lactamase superfamily II)
VTSKFPAGAGDFSVVGVYDPGAPMGSPGNRLVRSQTSSGFARGFYLVGRRLPAHVTPSTFEVAAGIVAIDTEMAGRQQVTSAYLLTGDQPALVETGPTTSAEPVVAGLQSLGIGPGDLAHVIVTHIHLDHAGGAGTIAGHFPGATLWVHDRGAPHLAAPDRLVASAARVYGVNRLRELFGSVEPVPGDRIRAVSDGDRLRLGRRGIDVLYTPGHASHHVALADLETGAVFTGDALGVHLPDVGILRPATPPPDIDLELSIDSIERIRRRARDAPLLFSHFGPVVDVEGTCSLAAERLRAWAEIVRGAMEEADDLDHVAQVLVDRTSVELDQAVGRAVDLERYEILASMRMNAMGLMRYWHKRAEREKDLGREAQPS